MWKWTGSGRLGAVADVLDQPVDGVGGERRPALGGEHVAVVGERLAQRRQHPQLIAPDRVNTGLAALGPPDMQRGRSPRLHLRPLQLAGLLGAQAVTVGPQGSGRRPDAPAARLRRLEQLLDLGGQQVSGRLGVCGPARR